MCGILCVIKQTPISTTIFQEALASMANRGPDAEGVWFSEEQTVALGHRRLAIVDLTSSGNQPFSNENQAIHLVCNGEIYNAPCLRDRLVSLGHQFVGTSDNETILHAYEEWGDECVNHLQGMFAFIIWDNMNKRLFAARDHVGIKPLYFKVTPTGIMIASSLSAILPFDIVSPTPDPLSIAYILSLGYIPAPHSIWKDYHKVEPGNCLSWSIQSGLSIRPYWSPPALVDDSCDDSHWPALFHETVDQHMMSDVPISLFLSGGIDSSAIASAVANSGHSPEAFTIGFRNSKNDETEIAKEVASHLKLNHICRQIERKDTDSLLEKTAASFDEPQGYSALLSMISICDIASKRNKVILSGDGGDECFGGYRWYFPRVNRHIGWKSRIRNWAKGISHTFEETLFSNRRPDPHNELLAHAWKLFPRFTVNEISEILSPHKLDFNQEVCISPLRKHYIPSLPPRRRFQRIDLMTFCSDSILPKVDRASMQYSLEIRVPFLDRSVIEWALARPMQMQESDISNGKAVLRSYLANRVPQSVLNHPKQGFSMQNLLEYDWERAINAINQSWWVREGYWSPHWKEIIDRSASYKEARIFVLLSLTKWAEKWIAN